MSAIWARPWMRSLIGRPAALTFARLEAATGGPARARVVLLLALVLAANTADVSTVGAVAGSLESSLRISNLQLGLLASVPSAVTGLATIPVGLLTDRVHRVGLLVVGIVLWSVVQAASGASQSFVMLLLIRMVLGAATAPAGPTVASLVGDYFPPRDRGQIYGVILGGELVGAGFGFMISGELATILSWRASFIALALPSIAVAYAIGRWLPEPARGGHSRLHPGATEVVGAEDATVTSGGTKEENDEFEQTAAQRKIQQQHVRPEDELVLRSDPLHMRLGSAFRYVLRIRTNRVLIVASSLGYFYFTGIQTFGIVFAEGRYGLSHGAATLVLLGIGLSALIGVVAGGTLADRLLARGMVNGRIIVAAVSFALAALLFLPALLLRPLGVAMVFYVAAAIAFGARNAPMDAARLDVMHHRLWGRAEAVRTVLRDLLTAAAPVTFGGLADELATGSSTAALHGFGAHASSEGLHLTFLLLLVTLAAGGILTFRAFKTYPRDISTALASEQATADGR